MRKVLCVLAVLAVVTPALAAPVVNGNFNAGETGWTRWQAPWGQNASWTITNAGPTPPEGTLQTSYNSFGWYQRVPVNVSEIYTLVGQWSGNVAAPGWAEVGYIMCTEGMSDSAVANMIDSGPAGIIAVKKDGWGLNPPPIWGWESIALSVKPGGPPLEFHATCQEVTIFIKLGTQAGPVNLSVDNIELVPEPATALLLGLPVLFLRRRR